MQEAAGQSEQDTRSDGPVVIQPRVVLYQIRDVEDLRLIASIRLVVANAYPADIEFVTGTNDLIETQHDVGAILRIRRERLKQVSRRIWQKDVWEEKFRGRIEAVCRNLISWKGLLRSRIGDRLHGGEVSIEESRIDGGGIVDRVRPDLQPFKAGEEKCPVLQYRAARGVSVLVAA